MDDRKLQFWENENNANLSRVRPKWDVSFKMNLGEENCGQTV